MVTVSNDRAGLTPGAKDPDWVAAVREAAREGIVYGVELAGVAEISAELGVPRQRISMWSARRVTSGFPLPLASLAAGPVYDMVAVRAWYEEKYGERA